MSKKASSPLVEGGGEFAYDLKIRGGERFFVGRKDSR